MDTLLRTIINGTATSMPTSPHVQLQKRSPMHRCAVDVAGLPHDGRLYQQPLETEDRNRNQCGLGTNAEIVELKEV